MYFPYLRARQFELISLRELFVEGILQGKIIPVLEPVKESFSNLNLLHKVLFERKSKSYLIVNPLQGEMPGDTRNFLNYIRSLNTSYFIPAFHFTNNENYILQCINDYGLSDCMLICLDNFMDDASFRDLCKNPSISHIMLLDPHKYRSLDRYIKSLDKFYIRLDDLFEKQQKNSDYLGVIAHKFSEEHLFFRDENYKGFADYTILSSEYTEGGSIPRAVVIHLTYLNADEENQIWIRHFTSETNDSIANVQGKFAEAAEKVILFCHEHRLSNSAIEELENYYNENKYPGLGTVKKITIKNHLNVISDYLNPNNGEGL